MSIQLHETVMGRRLIEHTLPKIGRALDRIADSMDNGVSLDDKPSATMSAYGKVHYAMGELERELHRLTVDEIKQRLNSIHRKLDWLGEIL